MIDVIPKISVIIISYKQEYLIKRALDSLIVQKDYLYEICVSDDCSPDRTWEVLLEYQSRYPSLIKLHRNEHNLGIFENIEVTWELPTGDIIYMMAGDDEAGEGYFKAVIDFVNKNRIDWKNELFTIYGDYKEIEPNGMSVVYTNEMAPHYNVLKLHLRHLISNRSTCYSKKILKRFVKVSQGRSYNAESSQDIQLALFSEKQYYIPVVGNIYYAGIGVSTRMSKEERAHYVYDGFRRLTEFVASQGHPFDKKDLAYIEYFKAYRQGNVKRALKYYLKSIDFSLGVKGLLLNRIFYVLKKKFR